MIKTTHFTPQESDRIGSYRKDDKLHRQYSLINTATRTTLLTVRTYWPGSTCFACVWVSKGKRLSWATGAARAAGGGYCKESAAIYGALTSAGFQFSESCNGRGLGMVYETLQSIAKFESIRSNYMIVEAHA